MVVSFSFSLFSITVNYAYGFFLANLVATSRTIDIPRLFQAGFKGEGNDGLVLRRGISSSRERKESATEEAKFILRLRIERTRFFV